MQEPIGTNTRQSTTTGIWFTLDWDSHWRPEHMVPHD